MKIYQKINWTVLYFIVHGILWINYSVCLGQSHQPLFIVEQYKEHLEQIFSENEVDFTEILATLEYYHENPINLNDTNVETLAHLYFLSDFQIQALISYIAQNGQMASIYELQLVNGFSQEIIDLILPFICIKPASSKKSFRFNQLWKYGKHAITFGYKTILEKQKGYTEILKTDKSTTRYLGSPFRSYLNYEFHFQDKIKLRIGADKDAGEEFFSGSQKTVDFLSFSLMLNDLAFIKRTIIGNYDLQFGQGLTLWTGFGYNMPMDGNCKKNAQTIKPAGTLTEYGYLQGMATSLNFKKISITGFYSSVKKDASITEVDEIGKVIKIQSIQNIGYHRTTKELKNKHAFTETLFGANLQHKTRYLQLGFTSYRMILSANLQPEAHLYNLYYFQGTENYNAGIDFKTLIRKVCFFGELTYSQSGAFAGLGGLQYLFHDNTSINIFYRNYAADYQNLHSSTIGQTSNSSNEKGILSVFKTLLPAHIQMTALVDIFSFPWLRYQVNSPSYGQEYRLSFSKELDRQINISIQYRYKNTFGNTPEENIPIVYTQYQKKQSFQWNISYQTENQWIFNSRIEFNTYKSENNTSSKGFLIYQDIIYNPVDFPLNFALRYALFDAEEYDNRLYAYERDFLYESSSPAYNYKGSRFYIMTNFKLWKNYLIGFRYSIWYYPEKEIIGSGLDEIQGHTKQEIKLQLRLKF